MSRKSQVEGFIFIESIISLMLLIGGLLVLSDYQEQLIQQEKKKEQKLLIAQVMYEETREYRIWRDKAIRIVHTPIEAKIIITEKEKGIYQVKINSGDEGIELNWEN
ncbi:MAG: hypothetical protein ACK5NA_04790 [Enterococcus sp.]